MYSTPSEDLRISVQSAQNVSCAPLQNGLVLLMAHFAGQSIIYTARALATSPCQGPACLLSGVWKAPNLKPESYLTACVLPCLLTVRNFSCPEGSAMCAAIHPSPGLPERESKRFCLVTEGSRGPSGDVGQGEGSPEACQRPYPCCAVPDMRVL